MFPLRVGGRRVLGVLGSSLVPSYYLYIVPMLRLRVVVPLKSFLKQL